MNIWRFWQSSITMQGFPAYILSWLKSPNWVDCTLNIIGAMLQFLENLVRISQFFWFFSDSSSWELTRSKASVASTRCGGQGGRAYIILLWLFNIWGTLNSTYSSLYAWAFLLFQTTKQQCSWNHGNCREYNKKEHIYYYVHVKAPCRPNYPNLVWLLLSNKLASPILGLQFCKPKPGTSSRCIIIWTLAVLIRV